MSTMHLESKIYPCQSKFNLRWHSASFSRFIYTSNDLNFLENLTLN